MNTSRWRLRASDLARAVRRRPAMVAGGLALALVAAVPLLPANSATGPASPGGSPDAVNQNSGAYTTSVTIEVPSYRGIEPKLALAYSSSAGNGLVGVGWQLTGLSHIDRVGPGRSGATWTTADSYLLDGEPLVASTLLGGTHVTKRQNFKRIGYDAVANTWTVTEPSGVVSTYAKAQSKKSMISAAMLVPRWLLSSVKDPVGNTVSYTYYCDSGDCYPDTITYNYTTIKFYRNVRPDRYVTAFGQGYFYTQMRIATIDVLVGGRRARTYALSYVTSPETGRSRLETIRRYGSDAVLTTAGAVQSGTALPATVAAYQPGTVNRVTKTNGLVGWCGAGSVLFGDYNGDDLTDVACHDYASGGTSVATGDGSFFTKTGSWNASFCGTGGAITSGDIDGDNLDDLVCYQEATDTIKVSRSTGSAFINAGAATVGGVSAWCTYASVKLRVIDANADGKGDLLCSSKSTATVTTGGAFKIGISTGSVVAFAAGAVVPNTWCPDDAGHSMARGDITGDGYVDFVCHNVVSGKIRTAAGNAAGMLAADVTSTFCAGGEPDQFGVGDLNGDGKADLFCGRYGATTETYTTLSAGDGLFGWGSYLAGGCRGMVAADFNGDGLADLRCGTTTQQSVALSHEGTTFSPLTVWVSGFTCPAIATVDLNDDGMADVACATGSGATRKLEYEFAKLYDFATLNDPPHPDLLTSINGPYGDQATITYGFPHTVSRFSTRTPSGYHPVAVTSVRHSAGSTTTYTYGRGHWDPVERRFLGYEEIVATNSISGHYVNSRFLTEAGYPTNRLSSMVYGGGGSTSQRLEYLWSTTAIAGVYTATLSSASIVRIDGPTGVQQRRTTNYTYDKYGNETSRSELRGTGDAGNTRVTAATYAWDTVRYIVNKPAMVTVLGGPTKTTVLRHSRHTYSNGLLVSTQRFLDVTNSVSVSMSNSYDLYGNLVTSTNENGSVVQVNYDTTYHQYPTSTCATSIRPSQCTSETWDPVLGVRLSATDVNGRQTSWTYDVLGRVTKESRPDGSSTTTTYNNWGTPATQYRQVSLSDGTADGLWVRSYLDGFGRVVKTVAEPDLVTETTYNTLGKVHSVTAPHRPNGPSYTTTFGYDGLGRQTSITHPDGSKATTTYRVEVKATDADFAVSRFTVTTCDEVTVCRRETYDSWDNLLFTSEWNGASEYRTRASYDDLGQLTGTTDALGNTSTRTWDLLGRKTSQKDADAGTWSYTYDKASQLLSQTDARGVTISYAYDALGRLTTQKVGTTTLVTNTYDEGLHGYGIGRLTSMTDQSGSSSWTYDAMGRVTATTQTIGATAYTVRQAYDLAGRRASITYPDGEVVADTYDAAGCLTKVGAYVTAATCAPEGGTSTRTLGNSVKQTFTYDPQRQWLASSTAATAAGTTLLSESYLHRLNGQIAGKSSSVATDSWTYTYDALNRLGTASNRGNATFSADYRYDALGRMTSGTGIGAQTYPGVNGGHVHAPSTVAGAAQTYDANGARTNDGSSTFGYDSFGQLTSSTTAGVTTTYVYNGLGARVKAAATVFITLGGDLLYQANGTSTSKYYYYGGERVARKDNTGAVSYYVGTVVGSPTMILNSAAAVVRTSVFGPYGAVLSQTGTLADPFGLGGQHRDATGLYKMGERMMSPKTGAFTSPDTSGYVDVAAPQSLNRYAYAGNDPINCVDPSGQIPVFVVGGSPPPSVGTFGSFNQSTGQTTMGIRFGTANATYTTPNGTYPSAASVGIGPAIGNKYVGAYVGGGVGASWDSSGPRGVSVNINGGAAVGGVVSASFNYSDGFSVDAFRSELDHVRSWSASYGAFGPSNTWRVASYVHPLAYIGDMAYGSPFENPGYVQPTIFDNDKGGDVLGPPIFDPLPDPAVYDDGSFGDTTNGWFNDGSSYYELNNGWDSSWDDPWPRSPLDGGSFWEFWSDGTEDDGWETNDYRDWYADEW